MNKSNIIRMARQVLNRKPATGKTFLAALLFCFAFASEALAQSSMTDSQIMEFVVKENDKGTPREEIFKKLIERGVSVDDIRASRQRATITSRRDASTKASSRRNAAATTSERLFR